MSDELKFCINCTHYHRKWISAEITINTCRRRAITGKQVNVVTGVESSMEFNVLSCEEERGAMAFLGKATCGREGRFYKAKEE